MVPEFSLAHLTLLSCAPPELVEVAARAGYDYVSLRPIAVTDNEPKFPLGSDRDLLVRTKRRLKDTGVRLLDIELARIVSGTDVKSYEPALAAAAELDGRFLLTSAWSPNREFVTEQFAKLCDLARPYGLTVCLEFVTFASVTTLSEAVAIVRAAGRENGAICIDTLHFFRSHCDVGEIDLVPKSWFPYLQICDAPALAPKTREGLMQAARADRKFLGQGGLPLADILSRLRHVPCSIEIPNAALSLELSPVQFARLARESAAAFFEEHVGDQTSQLSKMPRQALS